MNIVVVEDSPLIQAQLVRHLGQHPRVRVLGTATQEDEAVSLILATRADAVLLDLSLAPGSGIRVLERIRAAGSGARVLILTNNVGPQLQQACLRLGANGFYDKTIELDDCFEQLFGWLPPLPDGEAQRLAELQSMQLLDTPEQSAFDNLARLAADIAETPIALISLVDANRQWFLSHSGTDLRETSRSISFCAHAILDDALLEVSDALEDPRFHDNPLVIGAPHIRFYAGQPLVLASGERLGTLCVIDQQPKQLSVRQREALKTLASSAVAEIELRRRILHLEQEGERRRVAEARVEHLATRDSLTRLPNRTTFRDRLDQQVRFGLRRGTRLGVLLIELDHFKLINDTLGHEVGDEALLIVAQRLQSSLRNSDTVARLGGDEFAIILPDITGETEMMEIADKIIRMVAEPFPDHGHRIHLSASIGAALFPDHGHLSDQLLRHADLAISQAKRGGGSRSCLYSRQLSERAEETQALDGDLREAVRGNQLFLHYQPQVMLGEGRLHGVEALVRWRHPQLGVLPPDQFIPLAEQRGLIQLVTRQVLDQALAQLKAWDSAGLHVPCVAVNISPSEIRADFADLIAAALARHAVAPHRLELEITESTLTEHSLETLRILDTLRATGIGIAVDDFGVGYSSLAQLHRLPIDALKIDRSFMQGLENSAANIAIVSAVVTMAEALGLRTLAEGVEGEGQIKILEQLGCKYAQGYFMARPMPADEAGGWMRTFMDSGDEEAIPTLYGQASCPSAAQCSQPQA